MRDCCEPEKDKETNFHPVACGMENANDGDDRGNSVGAPKKKVHAEIYTNRRITRNSSSAKQSENLRSVVTVTKNSAFGRKFHVVGDHSKSPESEVCDLVNMREEGLMNIPKIMQSDSQISAIAGIITAEEIDETSQCESINNGDGQNQLVKDDKQEVTDTPGSIERKTGIFRALTEAHYSNPELKALFEAMPQSPHYRPFSAFGEKFRAYLIMGIELGFMAVADQIRSLADAELVGHCSVSTISSELIYLETMGYDVQRLRARLEELCQLARQKQAEFEAYQRDSKELEDWKTQKEAFEAKSLALHHSLAGLKSKIQRMEGKMALFQSVIDMQKAKEAEIELRMYTAKARLLDSEIERVAKLPW